MKKFYTFFAVLAGLTMTSTAMAASSSGTGFALVGALNYGMTNASGTISTVATEVKGGLGFGGGVLVNFSSIELGALYLSRTTKAGVLGVDVSTSAGAIHIPLMYRFGAMNFSFGIGGFYDLSLESGGGSNYGLTVGPRLGLGTSLFLDARFNLGLKSTDISFDTPQSVKTKEVLLLIGYKFM